VRIRLIEPESPSVHLWSPWRYPRLGLPIIGAALVSAGHDVRIYCPHLAPVDRDDVCGADLVGFSTTTSTAPAAYHMADDVRARGVPVIIGGSHVTFMAEEALGHADFVARGEGGEQTMLELIAALEGRRDLDSVGGLSYARDGLIAHNDLRAPCTDLDDLPVPDLSLIVGHRRMRSTPIMTSWGCPFACDFCSVTAMFGRAYRFRSAENVIAEIVQKRPRHIFFYDDNLAANPERLKTLLRLMIGRDLVVPWQAQVRADVARDTELVDLMARSGCTHLALGMESVDQATLDGFHKSQTVEDIAKAIVTLHEYGIKVHGMFVLGADTDHRDTVRDTVTFALEHRIDTLMLNILTPAPGTEWFENMDAQDRIVDKRWELYDGQHVVIMPRRIAPADLQAEVLRGYARFYSFRQWLACLAKLQIDSLRAHIWCWWFARRWSRDRRNRPYLAGLSRTLPSPQLRPAR
jgi:radical SAM superfamily enzyme YgiQ (UPF0313 family)